MSFLTKFEAFLTKEFDSSDNIIVQIEPEAKKVDAELKVIIADIETEFPVLEKTMIPDITCIAEKVIEPLLESIIISAISPALAPVTAVIGSAAITTIVDGLVVDIL